MDYRQLGRSDLQISRVSFGCMSLHDPRDAERIIHRSVELGINFYDTADLYDKGMNEETLGRILQYRREKVIIATKVGNQWREDGSGWDWNPRKDYIIRAVEHSLRRLMTDRIDLYQLHGGTMEDPIDETIEAFDLLQQQGKIRYYGISSIRPAVIEEYVRRGDIVSVMTQYSRLDRRPEEGVLDLLRQAGIGVLARGVLAKGLLAGKEATDYLDRSAEEMRRESDEVKKETEEANRLHPLGRKAMANIAVSYVLDNPAVTSAVVGVRTIRQLEEALG